MPNQVSSEVNDETAECISDGHLEYMREYIRRGDESARKAIERFLAGKLRHRLHGSEA
jgi:hypothetical protein